MVDRFIGVVIAIVGVASLAVIVSKKSDTAKVVGAVGSGLTNLIRASVSPVTGK